MSNKKNVKKFLKNPLKYILTSGSENTVEEDLAQHFPPGEMDFQNQNGAFGGPSKNVVPQQPEVSRAAQDFYDENEYFNFKSAEKEESEISLSVPSWQKVKTMSMGSEVRSLGQDEYEEPELSLDSLREEIDKTEKEEASLKEKALMEQVEEEDAFAEPVDEEPNANDFKVDLDDIEEQYTEDEKLEKFYPSHERLSSTHFAVDDPPGDRNKGEDILSAFSMKPNDQGDKGEDILSAFSMRSHEHEDEEEEDILSAFNMNPPKSKEKAMVVEKKTPEPRPVMDQRFEMKSKVVELNPEVREFYNLNVSPLRDQDDDDEMSDIEEEVLEERPVSIAVNPAAAAAVEEEEDRRPSLLLVGEIERISPENRRNHGSGVGDVRSSSVGRGNFIPFEEEEEEDEMEQPEIAVPYNVAAGGNDEDEEEELVEEVEKAIPFVEEPVDEQQELLVEEVELPEPMGAGEIEHEIEQEPEFEPVEMPEPFEPIEMPEPMPIPMEAVKKEEPEMIVNKPRIEKMKRRENADMGVRVIPSIVDFEDGRRSRNKARKINEAAGPKKRKAPPPVNRAARKKRGAFKPPRGRGRGRGRGMGSNIQKVAPIKRKKKLPAEPPAVRVRGGGGGSSRRPEKGTRKKKPPRGTNPYNAFAVPQTSGNVSGSDNYNNKRDRKFMRMMKGRSKDDMCLPSVRGQTEASWVLEARKNLRKVQISDDMKKKLL